MTGRNIFTLSSAARNERLRELELASCRHMQNPKFYEPMDPAIKDKLIPPKPLLDKEALDDMFEDYLYAGNGITHIPCKYPTKYTSRAKVISNFYVTGE